MLLVLYDIQGQGTGRLELTGPQSLTHEEMVAIIGDVIGRPLRYQEIPSEAAEQAMVQHGFPEWVADHAAAFGELTRRAGSNR